MNLRQISSIILAISLSSLGACKLKDDIKKSVESQPDTKTNSAPAAPSSGGSQSQIDASALDQAKKAFSSRVHYLNALQGGFEGLITDSQNPKNQAKIELKIEAKIPAAVLIGTTETEAEIRDRTDKMSLRVSIYEKNATTSSLLFQCEQAEVKPDYASGSFALSCQSASRDYTFYLDDLSNQNALTLSDRGVKIGTSILKNEIDTVQGYSVKIHTPFLLNFDGRLTRTSSAQPNAVTL